MLVIWKEPGAIPDSSATAAMVTATSSLSSTAGAAGLAGAGAGAAFGAALGASALPPTVLTSLEITMITRARTTSMRNTTTMPHTATNRASGMVSSEKGSRIAFSALGICSTSY